MIPLMAWKTFKLIAIKNIARHSTVYSIIILAHKKALHFKTPTVDEDSKKYYISSDKTSINHGKNTDKK